MIEHDNVRKKNVYMYTFTLLYSRKSTEHYKPAMLEKIKIIIKKLKKKKKRILRLSNHLVRSCDSSAIVLDSTLDGPASDLDSYLYTVLPSQNEVPL